MKKITLIITMIIFLSGCTTATPEQMNPGEIENMEQSAEQNRVEDEKSISPEEVGLAVIEGFIQGVIQAILD